jgi:hypothetical protein
MKKIFTLISVIAFFAISSNAQFIAVPNSDAVQLVNSFILSGVSASNVQYTGANNTLGHFSGGSNTNLGMNDGIILTTGQFIPWLGSPVTAFASWSNNTPGDSILNSLIPSYTTYDASVLEFDLNPVGNILEFQYVFASEEYPEFVGSSFNDVFGFFITGPDPNGGNYSNFNIAQIPGTSLPVAINNVNLTLNSQFYVDNQGLNGQTFIFDGFTTVLTAQIYVTPAATYHLKMAIADVGDGVFDSGVFLKAQSMKSYTVAGTTEYSQQSAFLFPNPVSDDNLLFSDQMNTFPVHVSIIDLSGKIVRTQVIESNHTGVNISGLYPGVYFVSSVDAAGTAKTMRIIRK